MRRAERRLLRINDELARLNSEEELAAGELNMHRHIDDDTRRDAAVSEAPADRAEAYQSAKDVARFEKVIARIRRRRERLEARRRKLLGRLGD